MNLIGEITKRGWTAPAEIKADGAFHRFSTNGSSTDTAGWYTLTELPGAIEDDGESTQVGAFGDWRSGESFSFCNRDVDKITSQERRALRMQQKKAEIEARKKKVEDQQRTADLAGFRFKNAEEINVDHPYLKLKGLSGMPSEIYQAVKSEYKIIDGDLNSSESDIIIPVVSNSGTIVNLQEIYQDEAKKFKKMFLFGGKVSGCWHRIAGKHKDEANKILVICEGWATGLSINLATGYDVFVAFSANNMVKIAPEIRRRYEKNQIIIAADEDISGVGLKKAREAARASYSQVLEPLWPDGLIRPREGLDFNDVRRADASFLSEQFKNFVQNKFAIQYFLTCFPDIFS